MKEVTLELTDTQVILTFDGKRMYMLPKTAITPEPIKIEIGGE